MAQEESTRGAGLSLWDRIRNDPEYVRARREIQARYNLPLAYNIWIEPGKWIAWLGSQNGGMSYSRRGEAFLEDVRALFKKFQIPEAWQDDFLAEIAGRPGGSEIKPWSLPKFNRYQDGEGVWRWECVITPETDLTDPAVLRLIQEQQKQYAGDPPKPTWTGCHPRRRDWRPVYEWYKSHPLFSLDEIAEKLEVSAGLLKKKFAELEDERKRVG